MRKKQIIFILSILLIWAACSDSPTGPISESPFVWVVGEQTVFFSSDKGEKWQDCLSKDQVPGYKMDQIFRNISFCNTLNGSLVGDYDFMSSTVNGKIWKFNPNYVSNYTLYSSKSMGVDTYYTCGLEARLYYVTGENYKVISLAFTGAIDFKDNNTLYGVDFIGDSTGWVVGEKGLIVYTKNAAKNWTKQTSTTTKTLRAVSIKKTEETVFDVWVVGDSGTILKSSNNGTSWTPVISGTTSNLTSISLGGDRSIYIAGHNGTILKSSDNGISFSLQQTPDISENLNSISFMNSDEGFAVGDYGVILQTTDGGNRWIRREWNSSKHLYSVCCVNRYRSK